MNPAEKPQFGQYVILRLLGRGGMGEVYEVEHRVLRKRYALKLLPEDFATRIEAIRRFEREAQVMANLEHQNIVRVDEYGHTDGRYWLRMELAHGMEPGVVSLRDFAEKHGGKIEQKDFAGILKQILRAMAYAHERGVVHRDLKPGNILLEMTAAGNVQFKVSDFGLARVVGEEFVRNQAQISVSQSIGEERTLGREQSLGEAKTTTGGAGASTRALLGTWEYMAPEQRQGQEADERSDVYALGLMCYRLLTGKELGIRLPSQIDKTLNPAWDEFVAKALEHNAEARYANGQAMLTAAGELLAAFIPGDGEEYEVSRSAGLSGFALGGGRKSHMLIVGLAAMVMLALGGWYFGKVLPEERRHASARGSLKVDTTPRSATVHLGGVPSQTTPASFEDVKIGPYKLSVSLNGYETEIREVVIKENDVTDLGSISLTRSTGILQITSKPEGDFVLEGEGIEKKEGRTPQRVDHLPTGEYRLTITRNDWTQTAQVAVVRGQTNVVEKQFVYGRVELISEPDGASVSSGESPQGKTPLALEVRPGVNISYTFSHEDFKSKTERIKVEGGKTNKLEVNLEKIPYPTLDAPWTNSLEMVFVPVPGTKVLFCICHTRRADYQAYAEANNRVDDAWREPFPEKKFFQDSQHPVVKVSWQNASDFCRWLTTKEQAEGKLSARQSYRLPKDWEWSVAVGLNESKSETPEAKNDKIVAYPWGANWPPTNGVGNYADQSSELDKDGNYNFRVLDYSDGYPRTSPVGIYGTNRLGLYDMGGNAWQLCQEDLNSTGKPIMRGGSWMESDEKRLNSSHRSEISRTQGAAMVGFRCVLTVQ